jgi:predicted Rossmann fold flavoprotein
MKISIIGGGAAGMMAGVSAIESDPSAQITIYDKNAALGRKLVLTGGGRCNITTAITDPRELLKNYPRGARWLKFAMYEFGPEAVYQWFEAHGIKLKTEGLRVFPVSENGEEIVTMFLRILKKHKAIINYETEVKNLDDLDADKIIITTGGKDGGGYELARSCGHTIVPLAPTLTSLTTEPLDLSGVSIEQARLKLLGHEFEGPFLFTHTGITGPAVFAISAYTAYENLKSGATLFVDFVPELNREQILNEIQSDPKGTLMKVMAKFVPKSLAKLLIVDDSKSINETSKKEIDQTIENLKNFKIQVTGRTPGREIVTAGGVDLSEVDPQTMQSKLNPKCYFAGELLDIDGFTGGFNLQSAWATGVIAGR